MEFENTVDLTQPEGAPDDAAQAEGEQERTDATPLSEIFAAEKPEETDGGPEKPSEPGWMRKKQDAARRQGYEQAQAELESWKAQFIAEQENAMAPLRAMALAHEADRLVASGEIKSKEMALKYLEAVGGVEKAEAPARDAQGRFQARGQAEAQPDVKARAEALHRQSVAIQKLGGPNMVELYMSDDDVRAAVDGGLDFNTVYGLTREKGAERAKAPGAVRSPNNARVATKSFMSMTRKEFEAFNRQIDSGQKFDARG